MLMSTPEVAALAQTLQPTVPLFNIIEGYQDVQTLVAVLETQQGFDLDNNQARFNGDGPLNLPDEKERVRYLGFFLLSSLKTERPLKLQLNFGSRYAYTHLILMLRAFSLTGTRKIRMTQGLSVHQDGTVNAAGNAIFEFDPINDWLKHPERVTGFLVYLIRPPGQTNPAVQPVQQEEALPPGIVRSAPGLNVYRSIDTRV